MPTDLKAIRQVGDQPDIDGAFLLELETTNGTIHARLHGAEDGDTAVLWVFGTGGGLGGPPAAYTYAWRSNLHRRILRRFGLITAGQGIFPCAWSM